MPPGEVVVMWQRGGAEEFLFDKKGLLMDSLMYVCYARVNVFYLYCMYV